MAEHFLSNCAHLDIFIVYCSLSSPSICILIGSLMYMRVFAHNVSFCVAAFGLAASLTKSGRGRVRVRGHFQKSGAGRYLTHF